MHVGIETTLLTKLQPAEVKAGCVTTELMEHLVSRRANLPALPRRRILDNITLAKHTVVCSNHSLECLNRNIRPGKRNTTAQQVHKCWKVGNRRSEIQHQTIKLHNLNKAQDRNRRRNNNPIAGMLKNP